jgi:hypothetical protein
MPKGKVMTAEEADKFLAEIRKIMSERQLNFGPAVNYYMEQQAKKEKK